MTNPVAQLFEEGKYVNYPRVMVCGQKMKCPVCGKEWEKGGRGYGFVLSGANSHVATCFEKKLKELGLEMLQPYSMEYLGWKIIKIKKLYRRIDGEKVIEALLKNGFTNPNLIGSLGRGGTSINDIDILLRDYKNTQLIKEKLIIALESKGNIEVTDWGGLYFYETRYGTIDVFFTDEDFEF